MPLLKGKVSIITGSSKGIGLAIARAFAKEGSDLVLNGRSVSLKVLQGIARDLESFGIRAIAVRGDVGSVSIVRRLIFQTARTFGRVDILVNNVGISPMASLAQIKDSAWNDVLRTNLTSAFLCSREVLPYMKKQRAGVILNISSGSAKSGGVGAHYAASKGGLNTLTRSTAFEGAPYGIRANAIAPGPIETEMAEHLFNPERKRRLESVIPLRRLGAPDDIASAAVFLSSGEASYITGEILEIDGGLNFYKPLSYPRQGKS